MIMHGSIPPVMYVIRLCLINYVHIAVFLSCSLPLGAKAWTCSLVGRRGGRDILTGGIELQIIVRVLLAEYQL